MKAPDPEWLCSWLCRQGEEGMGVRVWDRGVWELTSVFTAALYHYCSAELLQVGTPGSESRVKHGDSQQQFEGDPSHCLTSLQHPGATGQIPWTAHISALLPFNPWRTCHRICAGANPHLSCLCVQMGTVLLICPVKDTSFRKRWIAPFASSVH